MKGRLIGAAVLLATVNIHPASAGSGHLAEPGLPRPIQVRFEGYVGTKPNDIVLEASWLVRCLGKKYHFYVDHIFVQSGDISPSDIVSAVKPYHVNFILQGDKHTLAQFGATPPGQKITLTASYRTGSQQLLVGGIDSQT